MLDEKSVVPLYHQLQEIIKEQIKEGYWQEGSRVSSERKLMTDYDVSRATVRKSLRKLISEGLIYRKQGIGTFVSKQKVIQDLMGELSFNKQVNKQGLSSKSQVMHAAIEKKVSKTIKTIFQLKELEKFYKIIRVRLVNGSPLILEILYIPEKHARGLLEQDLENIAVFDYMVKVCKQDFTDSTLDIESIAISEFESSYLNINVGKPALSLERVVYSESNAIVLQKIIMRGDRGRFKLESILKV